MHSPVSLDFDHLLASEDDLRRTLSRALARGGDFAEIFLENRDSLLLDWQEGRFHAASSGRETGAGIRVCFGETTGYASTCDLSPEGMRRAAGRACEIARDASPAPPVRIGTPAGSARSPSAPDEDDEDVAARAAILDAADAAARAEDGLVAEVGVSLQLRGRTFAVVDSLGVRAGDRQILGFLQVNVLVRNGTRASAGRASLAVTGRRDFPSADEARGVARQAARKAVRMLDAREAPAGTFPVVFAPGDGAILFHEAVGHSLEGDIVAGGNSLFRDRVGANVAAPGVTLIDDATAAGLGGSFAVDDEGTPASRTVLIENGRLLGFLHDRASAAQAKAALTGNGRRQDFSFHPIPRMTNTCLAPGTLEPEEILASVKRGLYVRAVGAGQSNTRSGGFTFEVSDADWIENGKRTHPVAHASLVGDAIAVLGGMDMIGRDFAFGRSGGMCGKGQLVPVDGGMPTVRVQALVVGGRA